MSSGFVSAGSGEKPATDSDEWAKAQQEVATARESTLSKGQQEGGKSLFEHLQANKAKKQEAFEEANKLRNQFRSLDDDEIDFLDSVLESTRAKDAEVKKETLGQLAAFRKQREDAERALVEEVGTDDTTALDGAEWASGPRKRKKGKESSLQGLKVRKTSAATAHETVEKQTSSTPRAPSNGPVKGEAQTKADISGKVTDGSDTKPATGDNPSLNVARRPSSSSSKPAAAALGLGGYSSDEDN